MECKEVWSSSGRGRERRLNPVFEPKIEPTHNRGHVSRNKFSGYKVYFRCVGHQPVPGCTADRDRGATDYGSRNERISIIRQAHLIT
ncbi:hypothetical protein PUN28_000571 [Cardiocondyla obscurior]|uniref:Uncharacterized protein n=1 Tax=Cardiocondyla obscurior TaxID=286306 RepID=A0AAW2H044_9HYME